jgi:hypothetical protein
MAARNGEATRLIPDSQKNGRYVEDQKSAQGYILVICSTKIEVHSCIY